MPHTTSNPTVDGEIVRRTITTPKETIMRPNALKFLVALVAALVLLALPASAMADAMSTPITGAQMPSGTTIISGSKVSASDLASGKVTVLAFIKAKGATKKEIKKASKCMYVHPGTPFTNSGLRGASGYGWFKDLKGAVICNTHRGPTGWQKVGLRHKGDSHNCGNWVYPPHVKPHKPLIKGKIIMVRSFAKVNLKFKASISLYVSGSCGWAKASASATVSVSLRLLAKAKGEAVLRLYANAKGSAKVSGSASIHCEITVITWTPPTPPPPQCPPGTTGTWPYCVTPPPPPCTPGSGQTGCKDGTETPTPGQGQTPPGPNPPDDNPVSSQCWDENDPSKAVTPVWNPSTQTSDCPPGSFGS